MKFKIILAAFLWSVTLIGQIDSTLTSEPSEAYVFSFSGLNLRARPSTDAFIRAKLTHGTEVSVQRVSIELDAIEHRIGRWVEVSAEGRTGFLFDFMRVHQSHLIHIDFIKEHVRTEGGYLGMTNGDLVPVSVRKKAAVMAMLDNL